MRRPGSWALAIALALFGACGGDKTTALDIKLDVTGAIDQVRVDSVTVGGSGLSLTGEQTLFPARPTMLKSGDVLTLWFKDNTDGKTVVVTATGRLCGRDATGQVPTPERKLAKGQTVATTL